MTAILMLAVEANDETTWPEVILFLAFIALLAFIIWLILR